MDWLRLAEDLRALGLRGRVADRGEAGEEVWISFRAPGYAADAQVDPRTGAYRMVVTDYGLVAVLNDLHKGRDAPGGWKLFLDLSALFLALVSLTGLLLGVLLPKSRRAALLVLGLGGLLFLALACAPLASAAIPYVFPAGVRQSHSPLSMDDSGSRVLEITHPLPRTILPYGQVSLQAAEHC